MKRLILILAVSAGFVCHGDEFVPVSLRGRAQILAKIKPAQPAAAAVIFLPGDGGWRGAAIEMARTIASWGYEVYGFDTKRYLEMCAQDRSGVTSGRLADDMRGLTEQVRSLSAKPVILVGWSQGAGMAVAAASGKKDASTIKGVLTLGLPESAVLGWDWKATLAILARRMPDQPAFAVKPLLRAVAPTPIWMIHATNDEYTSPDIEKELYQTAGEPKRLWEIAGANHRFDWHRAELYRSMKEGLGWIDGL
jgi:dienelactone hydrolase